MKRLKKGDKVRVISGKHRGLEGIILKIDNKNDSAFVEKINMVKKHQKPSQENQDGGIIEVNKPLPLSKLALLDPKGKGNITKVKYGLNKDNKKVRISKKTNLEIASK
ncbi:MAG: 50S ribosomal protein L24 [Mycoplasmoidaceae bacterium]